MVPGGFVSGSDNGESYGNSGVEEDDAMEVIFGGRDSGPRQEKSRAVEAWRSYLRSVEMILYTK